MSYVKEIFTSVNKDIIIVKKYHNHFAAPTKAKTKQKRLPKTNETDLTQEKINERVRKEKYTRLLADNFKAGDFYITFTTATKMAAEEFKLSMANFMKRLRREYAKWTDEKVKYFRVMENLEGKGRPHAHMLIPSFCPIEKIRAIMARLWPDGHTQVKVYGGEGEDACTVAGYFSDQDKKDKGAKIDTSRGNMIRREPKKYIIHAETFSDDVRPPKGYRIVKKPSNITNTFQYVVFQRIEELPEGRKSVNDMGRRKPKSNKKLQSGNKPKSRTHSRKND